MSNTFKSKMQVKNGLKQKVLEYFGGDFLSFAERYFPGGKLTGGEYRINCISPSHQDEHPSMDFNVTTGQFNCLSCDFSGDIFTAYATTRGLNVKTDFTRVLEGIATDFGIGNGQRAQKPPPKGQEVSKGTGTFKRKAAPKTAKSAKADTAAKGAAQKAVATWERAEEADPEHPYLKRKGIKPHGIRQNDNRQLIVSVFIGKRLASLQFINEDGRKLFLKGGATKGGYYIIKGPRGGTVYLCEGIATGATIHEVTDCTVIVAFSCGNLMPVAESIVSVEQNIKSRLVICADNDQWKKNPDGTVPNPGRTHAIALGWKFSLKVAIPSFPKHHAEQKPTDFNDLYRLDGAEAVKIQVEAAKHPSELLLAEATTDPSAPFRKENLEGLRALKAKSQEAYMRLRAKLKPLKIGVTALDKAIDGQAAGGGGKKSNHIVFAKSVIWSFGAKNILNTGAFLWKWDGKGLWQHIDDRVVKQTVHKILERSKEEIMKTIVESILDLVKTEIFRADHRFNVNTTAINCINGELHWTGAGWKLEKHKRENYRTTQIPVKYDPKAIAPRFKQFLSEVFEHDLDQKEKAILVCEALGYSLLSSTKFEKFFLLIGPGANGKSVLMSTLAALVGAENVAAVQPSQFENKFQRAHLHSKLVNLVTEIAEGHKIADAQLKAIVSGELTTAEHKHKPPFDFKPFATCWFGTNHMPHTRDFSNALFRRAIIMPFNRTFAEPEQDKQLTGKLIEEISGILNLALEAVDGILKRGEFTQTESCKKAKREWRLNCDQVAQFAEDECVFDTGAKVLSKRIYEAYFKWATEAGIKLTLNRNNFTDRICRLGIKKTRGTGGVRMLAGVELRNPY